MLYNGAVIKKAVDGLNDSCKFVPYRLELCHKKYENLGVLATLCETFLVVAMPR
jgi:hypothetical protein